MASWLTNGSIDWLIDQIDWQVYMNSLIGSFEGLLTGWLPGWLTLFVTYTLSGWVTDWLAVWLTDWTSDKLSRWLTDWWTDCLAFYVTYSLFDWSSGWHAVLFHTLSDWKTGWPPVQRTLCLTDWLAFCVTYTLSDWLTCWLAVFPTYLHAGWLSVLLFTWQILGFKLFTPGNFAKKCLSKQVKLCFWSVSDCKTVGFVSQSWFTISWGKKTYFYRLSSVLLSIFSLQTSRPLFDCSHILENAKIHTVLLSRSVFGKNEPKLPKDLLSLKPATKKWMLFVRSESQVLY